MIHRFPFLAVCGKTILTGDFVVVFVLESSCTFTYTPVLRTKTPENLLAKTFFRKLLGEGKGDSLLLPACCP